MEMIQIPKEKYDELNNELLISKSLVASMAAEIKELKAKLNKNSTNSNKPPSSDGPRKNNIKNSRKPSGKKSGGQPGHEGKTKELTSTPERIVELKPKENCECGGNIITQTDDYTIRQVIDTKPVEVYTVEYRAHDGTCEQCGKAHKASFPDEAKATVSYGTNLSAVVTYLNTYQLIPLERTKELIKDLYGEDISEGFIVDKCQEAYEKLESSESRTVEEILSSEVANADETGMRVGGKNHWLHVVSTENSTVYGIHKKRGCEAINEMNILPRYEGTLVHDHLRSYYHYKQYANAECNQHHLRHLAYLYENLGETWAGEMAGLLLRIKRHVDLSKLFGSDQIKSLELEDVEIYEGQYRDILTRAAEEENLDTPRSVEAKRMINRMIKYEAETLLFMTDFDVPFTNNLAERDLRMPKCKQKISGGFRSMKGAKAFARIRGFISTVKKRGKNVLNGLVSTFAGRAEDFLYPDPAPSK